jgi:hypothetical protein
MSSTPSSPAAAGSRGNGIPRVIVATTALLTFISFWRAAAIVLNDLASSAYYAGGEAEAYIGKTAPWFILGDHVVFLRGPRGLRGKLQHVRPRRRLPRGKAISWWNARQVQRFRVDV